MATPVKQIENPLNSENNKNEEEKLDALVNEKDWFKTKFTTFFGKKPSNLIKENLNYLFSEEGEGENKKYIEIAQIIYHVPKDVVQIHEIKKIFTDIFNNYKKEKEMVKFYRDQLKDYRTGKCSGNFGLGKSTICKCYDKNATAVKNKLIILNELLAFKKLESIIDIETIKFYYLRQIFVKKLLYEKKYLDSNDKNKNICNQNKSNNKNNNVLKEINHMMKLNDLKETNSILNTKKYDEYVKYLEDTIIEYRKLKKEANTFANDQKTNEEKTCVEEYSKIVAKFTFLLTSTPIPKELELDEKRDILKKITDSLEFYNIFIGKTTKKFDDKEGKNDNDEKMQIINIKSKKDNLMSQVDWVKNKLTLGFFGNFRNVKLYPQEGYYNLKNETNTKTWITKFINWDGNTQEKRNERINVIKQRDKYFKNNINKLIDAKDELIKKMLLDEMEEKTKEQKKMYVDNFDWGEEVKMKSVAKNSFVNDDLEKIANIRKAITNYNKLFVKVKDSMYRMNRTKDLVLDREDANNSLTKITPYIDKHNDPRIPCSRFANSCKKKAKEKLIDIQEEEEYIYNIMKAQKKFLDTKEDSKKYQIEKEISKLEDKYENLKIQNFEKIVTKSKCPGGKGKQYISDDKGNKRVKILCCPKDNALTDIKKKGKNIMDLTITGQQCNFSVRKKLKLTVLGRMNKIVKSGLIVAIPAIATGSLNTAVAAATSWAGSLGIAALCSSGAGTIVCAVIFGILAVSVLKRSYTKIKLNTKDKLKAMQKMGVELIEKLQNMIPLASEKEKIEINTFIEELNTLSEKLKKSMGSITGWMLYLLRGNNFKELEKSVEDISVYILNFTQFHEAVKERAQVFYKKMQEQVHKEAEAAKKRRVDDIVECSSKCSPMQKISRLLFIKEIIEKEVYDNNQTKLLKKKHPLMANIVHNGRIDRANERSKLWETYKENVKKKFGLNETKLAEIKKEMEDRKKELNPDDKRLMSDEQKEFLLIDIDYTKYMYQNKKALLKNDTEVKTFISKLITIFQYINGNYRPIEKIINDSKLITDKNAKDNLIKFLEASQTRILPEGSTSATKILTKAEDEKKKYLSGKRKEFKEKHKKMEEELPRKNCVKKLSKWKEWNFQSDEVKNEMIEKCVNNPQTGHGKKTRRKRKKRTRRRRFKKRKKTRKGKKKKKKKTRKRALKKRH